MSINRLFGPFAAIGLCLSLGLTTAGAAQAATPYQASKSGNYKFVVSVSGQPPVYLAGYYSDASNVQIYVNNAQASIKECNKYYFDRAISGLKSYINYYGNNYNFDKFQTDDHAANGRDAAADRHGQTADEELQDANTVATLVIWLQAKFKPCAIAAPKTSATAGPQKTPASAPSPAAKALAGPASTQATAAGVPTGKTDLKTPDAPAPSSTPAPAPKQTSKLVTPTATPATLAGTAGLKSTTLPAGTPNGPTTIKPVVLVASSSTGQMAAPGKPPAPAAKPAPITTGSQQASVTISTASGACPCTSCTLRAGRSVISFEYDPDKKGDLDVQGAAAMAAASKQSLVDVAAEAKAPGLCASDLCTAQGVSTSTVPASLYGGTGPGIGVTNSSWQVTGSCVDNKKYVAVPDHPTISVPTTGIAGPGKPSPAPATVKTLTLTTPDKPSYTTGAEGKPGYTLPAAVKPTGLTLPAAKPAALTVPTVKPTTLTLPSKSAPNAPVTCPKGQSLMTVAGKSVCSGAAAAGHIG